MLKYPVEKWKYKNRFSIGKNRKKSEVKQHLNSTPEGEQKGRVGTK